MNGWMWKTRHLLLHAPVITKQKKLRDAHIRLRSGIDAIIQGSPTSGRQDITQAKDAAAESSEDGNSKDHSHNDHSGN